MRVFFVSHTHWDREWYITREKSRCLLVELMEELFSILEEQDDYCFMLDGQTLAVEDYLEVRPDRREALRAHVSSGRLTVGPWYVLPDEFLVSGESHIRNFLLGRIQCGDLGGAMEIGYLPDSFGHPSQMPQLLRGLGMGEMVFWRGLGPEITRTEFTWEGKDGSEILGVNMPYSYGIAACMPEDPDAFVERLKLKIGMLAPLTDGDAILLMNGVDHVAPQRSFLPNLRRARARLPEHQLTHGHLLQYMAALRGQAAPRERASGELRSGFRAYLLGGTISTRMYVKQANYRAETMLEKYAEPLATLAWALHGQGYPAAELRHAWKLLLSNLPHDSICGCGVDEVHEEMLVRYRFLNEICEHLINRSAGTVAGSAAGPAPGKGWDGSFLVFNPLLQARRDDVRVSVVAGERLLRKVNYDTGSLDEYEPGPDGITPSGVVVLDPSGSETPGVLHAAAPEDTLHLSLHTQPEMFRGRRAEFSFTPSGLPAAGCGLYRYRLTYGAVPSPRRAGGIENEFFRVGFDARTSSLTVEDRRTGVTYQGQHRFEDTADAGDEYTYSWPVNDTVIALEPSSATVAVEGSVSSPALVVSGALRLPVRLSADRTGRSSETVDLEVRSTFSLQTGTPRIDVRTEVDNTAEDHRLRVLFPLWAAADSASSEGIFSVDERPVTPRDRSAYADWVEPPSTNPQKSFVSIHSGTRGLAVANRGLPEYEVFRDENGSAVIALTLLRCVGWLSRPDLLARKGNGGWTIPTPGAQCPGKHLFEYCLIPHRGSWEEADVLPIAHQFAVPALAVGTEDSHGSPGAEQSSFVAVDRPEIVLSALKKAEDGEGCIARFWNASGRTVRASLRFARPLRMVCLTDLAERRGHELTPGTDALPVEFPPWKIVTLELWF